MKARTLALIAALVLTVGCGGKTPPITSLPATVESSVATADQTVTAGAIHILGIIESAGHVANRASQIEQALYLDGAISPQWHATLSGGFRALSDEALSVIDKIESGAVETWPALKALVDPLLAKVQSLIDSVTSLGRQAGALRTWVDVLKDVVIDGIGRILAPRLGGAA